MQKLNIFSYEWKQRHKPRKENGFLIRHGNTRSGYWEIISRKLNDDLGSELDDRLGDNYTNLNYTKRRILEILQIDARTPITQIAEKLGFSTTAIEKNIDFLKDNGYLLRHGNTKTGYWEIVSRKLGDRLGDDKTRK
ncbi:MAG: winged helix-turn-helix transcriptional regulator [Muribaculaceae bacterium]|nr:winged helix-turn-helix transcriptional regulator [Muribaculaceae bacterium]